MATERRGVLSLEVDSIPSELREDTMLSRWEENPVLAWQEAAIQRVVLHKTHPFCSPCKSPTGTRLLQQRPPEGSFQQLHTGVEYPGSSRRSQLRTRVRGSQLSFHSDRPLSDSGSVPMSSDTLFSALSWSAQDSENFAFSACQI